MIMTREEQRAKAAHEYIQSDSVAAGNEVLAFGDFINGAKWADFHPQWIPVEERLPEENEEVLAYNSLYNEKYLCVYHNGKFEDYLGELGKGAVSHWMPIVPPRKEE
jgi:hypothetical protein